MAEAWVTLVFPVAQRMAPASSAERPSSALREAADWTLTMRASAQAGTRRARQAIQIRDTLPSDAAAAKLEERSTVGVGLGRPLFEVDDAVDHPVAVALGIDDALLRAPGLRPFLHENRIVGTARGGGDVDALVLLVIGRHRFLDLLGLPAGADEARGLLPVALGQGLEEGV